MFPSIQIDNVSSILSFSRMYGDVLLEKDENIRVKNGYKNKKGGFKSEEKKSCKSDAVLFPLLDRIA